MLSNNSPALKQPLPAKKKNKSAKNMKKITVEESLTSNRLLQPISNPKLLRGRVALVPHPQKSLNNSPDSSFKKKAAKNSKMIFHELNEIKIRMTKAQATSPKHLLSHNLPFFLPHQSSSLHSSLKVNKIMIDELNLDEIKKLKGRGRLKQAEIEENLMNQRKGDFGDAKPMLFSDFQNHEAQEDDEENSFVRSTSPENLITLIIDKFTNCGINANTLERFIADIIFLVEQEYKTLSLTFNFEILISVICESLLFGVLKLQKHIKKALVIIFQSIENSTEAQNLDIELLISNAFQIWQKLHKKKNPLQSEVLSCLCLLARKIKPSFFYFPDNIRMIFLSHCLETIGSIISEFKALGLPFISPNSPTSNPKGALFLGGSFTSRFGPLVSKNNSLQDHQPVQNKLHWLLETALRNNITRISIGSHFVAKGALQNLVFAMKKLLADNCEVLIWHSNHEQIFDYLAVWGLLLKDSDTLSFIEKGKDKETLGRSLYSFFRVFSESFSAIIESEKTENMGECLGVYLQIFQNRKYYESEIIPWDERLVVLIVKTLTKPLLKRPKHQNNVPFKRKTYCVAAEKLTRMVYLYVTLGSVAFDFSVPKMVSVFKPMLDETLCFLQEDKCFCYPEARIATENLLSLIESHKSNEVTT